ncbi:MAG: hypothetical protein H6732_15080 [Alphaproteobacteria bacterium]|nr:hypothetical protein [Alphaproteobacteria bacterium]
MADPSQADGPALDLGDLDWTIPPDSQPGSGPTWGSRSIGWVAQRFRTAMLHAVVSMTLTGLTLGWWVASGRLPSSDPTVGIAALLLHIAAFITAWMALRAAVDTWQGLYDRLSVGQTPPKANMTQVITLASALVMCFHAAMVVSSILP